MKKHITLLMAIVCMFALLNGCVQQDIGVAINSDGTGSVSATIGIEKDAYEQLVGMGTDIFEGKETSIYEYDGNTYVSYTEKKEYESYEDMEKALLEMTYGSEVFENFDTEDLESEIPEESDGSEESAEPAEPTQPTPIFKNVTIEKNTGLFYSTYTFKAELNPQEITETEDTEMELPIDTDSFRMTFTITMPSDITQASGGKIEANKAVFEIDDITEAQEFSIICEQNNAAAVIVIIVVLVIILGLFFFFTKRKG